MKSTKQQIAKDLYLHTDKTQSEIADILSVDRKTVYLWMKGGKWEEMRIAARQTASVIQQNLYNHIDEVEKKIRRRDPDDRCPTMQEVEMLRKLINLTKVVGAKTAATYMEVFEQAILYAAKTDKDLATKMTKLADKMIRATILDMDFNRTELRLDVEAKLDELDKQEAEFADKYPVTDGGEFDFSEEFSEEYHGAEMGKNGEFYSHSGTQEDTTTTTPKTAANSTYEENNNKINHKKFPTQNISPNGEFSLPGTPSQASATSLQNEGKAPSGVWGKTIITIDDYYRYASCLRNPSTDITATISINGKTRNLMAFQYNLRQLRLCKMDQVILTDHEFITRFQTNPAFRENHLNYSSEKDNDL